MVRPDTPSVSGAPIPLNPGYNNGFLKRIGEAEAEVQGLGERPREDVAYCCNSYSYNLNSNFPRSLEFGEGVEAQPLVQSLEEAEKTKKKTETNSVEKEAEETGDQDTERRRRSVEARDANGNKVVSVRRVRRETGEEEEEADIQTERIIQVRESICWYPGIHA